jgi:2-dehydropantoate 2-reductase
MSDALPADTAVVGPGAIGTAIAAALHLAGRTPLLYGRTPRSHLTLRVGDRDVTVPGPVRTDSARIDRPVEIVFLAVKATHTAAAAAWLAALSGPKTLVCVLQNGIEQVETVGPHLARGQIVPAVVWFPAQRLPDGAVRLRGDMRLSLPDTPASRVVARSLHGTLCAVELAASFQSEAWRKLLQNAAAGLMALTHRRSGMFARADMAALTLAYLRECLTVARAAGAELSDAAAQEILAKFQAAPADMGTSILADRQAGEPLEWDIRNGVVQRLGHAHGIPTPISDVLVPLLSAASDGPG